MSINSRFFSQGQVAISVPFDEATSKGFTTPSATDVQTALEHVRDHTIYVSRTQATTVSGTLTLTSTDANLQYLTGSATGYNVQLPSASTLTIGSYYQIINLNSISVQIKDGAGSNLFTLGQNSIGYIWLQLNSTTAGAWVYSQTSVNVTNGLIQYNLVSSTAFATSSTTDVIITGFTLTPQAGTYAVWFNGNIQITSGTASETSTIYKNGSAISDTIRSIRMASANQPVTASSMTITTFDGTQTVDVRVKTSAASLTVNERSLLLIRLGT